MKHREKVEKAAGMQGSQSVMTWELVAYEVRMDVAGLVVPGEQRHEHVSRTVAHAVASPNEIIVLQPAHGHACERYISLLQL